MGIQTWVLRKQVSHQPNETKANQQMLDSQSQTIPVWETLETQVKQCTLCNLCQSRTHAVFGTGSKQARIMFIGEGPGAQEDMQGEPFVGRAGQLLNRMLLAIQLKREEIFITNVVKCRPPQNRDPTPEEIASCTPYLKQQIELIRPELLVALGRVAAQYLLSSNLPLSRLRNTIYSYGDQKIPLMVTFHPAYLLRSPKEKAKSYEDLIKIKTFLGQSHES